MDLTLQAMKVTPRSLGQTMSTLVVQEHHLWLNLTEIKEVNKISFLDSPISQASLLGEAVEIFAQQFPYHHPSTWGCPPEGSI